ncbi:MAG: hypothetical protein ACPGVU_10675 [Limisphaerales bacterium]
MKIPLLLLGLFVVISGHSQTAPVLTISTRDLGTMIRASVKIAEAYEPGSSKTRKGGIFGDLGAAMSTGTDRTLPWHHATYQSRDVGSLLGTWYAFYIPVTNYTAFAEALPGGDFRARHKVVQSGNYAVLIRSVYRNNPLSDLDLKNTVDWAKIAPRKLEHDVSVVFSMDDQLRQLAGLGVMLAQASLAEQFKPAAKRNERVQTAMLLPGAYELLAMHLDLATAIVKGTKQVTITLDVEEDRLLFRDRVDAVPGTEFARMVQPSKSNLSSLIQRYDADLPVVVAAHIEGDSHLRKSFLKAIQDGSEASGKAFDAQFMAETEGLLNAMLPVSVAMAVDWRRKYQTAAVYQFAKKNAAAIQRRLLEFIPRMLRARAKCPPSLLQDRGGERCARCRRVQG